MKDIPMMFKGPLVRAILEDRKTQTRRLKFNGQVGDRIWVKETFASRALCPPDYIYREDFNPQSKVIKWTPSLLMHRSASRITLEVTAYRVEPLQEISESDAIAEGVQKVLNHIYDCNVLGRDGLPNCLLHSTAKEAFRHIWDSLLKPNDPNRWIENPLVHVVTFKRITL